MLQFGIVPCIEEDVRVLMTVATLKNQRKQHSSIIGYLAREEYLEPTGADDQPPAPSKDAKGDKKPEPTTKEQAFATLKFAQEFVKPYTLKGFPCILIWGKIIYDMIVLKEERADYSKLPSEGKEGV